MEMTESQHRPCSPGITDDGTEGPSASAVTL